MTPPRNCDSPIAEYGHRTVFGLDLLVPDPEWNDVCISAMARACAETDVKVVSSIFMSNHDHHLLYSPKREFAKWQKITHQILAEKTNKRLDRKGQVWSTRKPYFATLHSMRQAILRVAYHICNATRAGIARTFEEHRGLVVVPRNEGYVIEIARPECFGKRSRVAKHPALPVVGLRELAPVLLELAERDRDRIAQQAVAIATAEANLAAQTMPRALGECGESRATPDAHSTDHAELRAIDELVRSVQSGVDPSTFDYAALLMRIVRSREAQYRKERRKRGREAPGPARMAARNAERIKARVWEHMSPADFDREYKLVTGPRALPFFYDSLEEREFRKRRDAAFIELHRAAWSRWVAKETDVLFPRGTMKVRGWPNVVVDTNPPELPLPIAT